MFLQRYRRPLLGLMLVVYLFIFVNNFMEHNPRIRTTMFDLRNIPASAQAGEGRGNICYVDFNILGPVTVDLWSPNLTKVEAENTHVLPGGRWSPSNCEPWQMVAILIPYRDRWEHLQLLLKRLHPMLQKQKVSYQIFVIEQAGNDTYNKGMLYNIGVKEALKLHPFDCFIFHDVDLLPENDKNIYYCDEHLRHFSSAIDEWRYTLLYSNNAGGVVALNYDNVVLVNGFSNIYWGWGGEDDDFSARAEQSGLLLTRPPQHIGRYRMIRHKKRRRAMHVYDLLYNWQARWKTDGLNSIYKTNIKVLYMEQQPLYTWFLVDVGKPPDKPIIPKDEPIPNSMTVAKPHQYQPPPGSAVASYLQQLIDI